MVTHPTARGAKQRAGTAKSLPAAVADYLPAVKRLANGGLVLPDDRDWQNGPYKSAEEQAVAHAKRDAESLAHDQQWSSNARLSNSQQQRQADEQAGLRTRLAGLSALAVAPDDTQSTITAKPATAAPAAFPAPYSPTFGQGLDFTPALPGGASSGGWAPPATAPGIATPGIAGLNIGVARLGQDPMQQTRRFSRGGPVKPARLRNGIVDVRPGGPVPPGPPGVDTVPALTNAGPVLLDSPPEGPAEYVVTGDMMERNPGLRDYLDALRAHSHDPGRVARRRQQEGQGGAGAAAGGPIYGNWRPLEGSVDDYVQAARQRAVYGAAGITVPPVSDVEMANRPAPDTRFDGNAGPQGSAANLPQDFPGSTVAGGGGLSRATAALEPLEPAPARGKAEGKTQGTDLYAGAGPVDNKGRAVAMPTKSLDLNSPSPVYHASSSPSTAAPQDWTQQPTPGTKIHGLFKQAATDVYNAIGQPVVNVAQGLGRFGAEVATGVPSTAGPAAAAAPASVPMPAAPPAPQSSQVGFDAADDYRRQLDAAAARGHGPRRVMGLELANPETPRSIGAGIEEAALGGVPTFSNVPGGATRKGFDAAALQGPVADGGADYWNGYDVRNLSTNELGALKQRAGQAESDWRAEQAYLALPQNERGPMPEAVARAMGKGPSTVDDYLAAVQARTQGQQAAAAKQRGAETIETIKGQAGIEKARIEGEARQKESSGNARRSTQNRLADQVSALAKGSEGTPVLDSQRALEAQEFAGQIEQAAQRKGHPIEDPNRMAATVVRVFLEQPSLASVEAEVGKSIDRKKNPRAFTAAVQDAMRPDTQQRVARFKALYYGTGG